MTHSTDEQIKDAAAFAGEAINDVCLCGSMQAMAILIAAQAKEVADAFTRSGHQATPEQIAQAMANRAIRIIRNLPYPKVH